MHQHFHHRRPQKEKREEEPEKIFEEITAEKFLNMERK